MSNSDDNACKKCPISSNMMIYKSIIILIAMYASFRHNKGFNLTQFILAILFQEIYIVYILAVDRDSLFN